MMQDLQLSGSAESGFGVTLTGFHSSTQNFPKQLAERVLPSLYACRIAQAESAGFQMFLRAENRQGTYAGDQKTASFRREPHKFFPDLPEFLRTCRVRSVDDMVLTESYGSYSLTLLYTEAPLSGGSNGA